jgi:hypothetical protein
MNLLGSLSLQAREWAFFIVILDFNLHLLMRKLIIFVLLISAGMVQQALAQKTPLPTTAKPVEPKKELTLTAPVGPLESDSILITVILKHQQNKNLPEMKRILEAQGFWDLFPGSDVRVISWTLAMGLGHVIILKVPPSAIRRLNLAIENGAWGAFDSEIYLSYDYKPIWLDSEEKRAESKEERN